MENKIHDEKEGKGKEHDKKFPIFINDTKYFVTKEHMTGAELKELGKIPSGNRLFKEVPGNKPDQPIADDTVVELKAGDKFYDLPHGVVGGDFIAKKY